MITELPHEEKWLELSNSTERWFFNALWKNNILQLWMALNRLIKGTNACEALLPFWTCSLIKMLNLKSTATGDPSAEQLSIKQTASILHQKYIALKHEDEYDQRGPHGIDIKGSFTSKSLDSQPRCFLVIYVIFMKCKSLYKFPKNFFFSLWIF